MRRPRRWVTGPWVTTQPDWLVVTKWAESAAFSTTAAARAATNDPHPNIRPEADCTTAMGKLPDAVIRKLDADAVWVVPNRKVSNER